MCLIGRFCVSLVTGFIALGREENEVEVEGKRMREVCFRDAERP